MNQFRGRSRGKRRFFSLTILGVLVVLFLGLETIGRLPGRMTPLLRVDLATEDFLMRLHVSPPPQDVVIVAIDDASFAWTGYQWPWPRAYLAKIVDAITAGEPQAVGVDVLLSERSDDPAGDQALAEAVARAPYVVLPVLRCEQGGAETLAQPWPELRAQADALGIAPMVLDEDAVLRRLPAYTTFNGEIFYWTFDKIGGTVSRCGYEQDSQPNTVPTTSVPEL